MSNPAACPDGSLECKEPMKLSCSFKGCEPQAQHNPSYDVLTLGQTEKALRSQINFATCGNEEARILVSDDSEEDAVAFVLHSCIGGFFLEFDGHFVRLNQENSECNILFNASLEAATCFHINFGACGPNTATFTPVDGGDEKANLLRRTCTKSVTECSRLIVQENFDTKMMFMVPVEKSMHTFQNKGDFELALSTSEFQQNAFHFVQTLSYQCLTNQTWSFTDPAIR